MGSLTSSMFFLDKYLDIHVSLVSVLSFGFFGTYCVLFVYVLVCVLFLRSSMFCSSFFPSHSIVMYVCTTFDLQK